MSRWNSATLLHDGILALRDFSTDCHFGTALVLHGVTRLYGATLLQGFILFDSFFMPIYHLYYDVEKSKNKLCKMFN